MGCGSINSENNPKGKDAGISQPTKIETVKKSENNVPEKKVEDATNKPVDELSKPTAKEEKPKPAPIQSPQQASMHEEKQIRLKSNESATKLMNEGWNLINQTKIKEAYALFMKATEVDPDCFETWYTAGNVAKFQVHESDEKCLELYLKASKLNPEHYDSHVQVGLCLNNLKRNEEAAEYYIKSVSIAEKTGEKIYGFLITNVGAIYIFMAKEKDNKKAADFMVKYYERNDFEQNYRDMMRHWLALAYYNLKDYDNFIKVATRVVFEESFCSNKEYRRDTAKWLADYYRDKNDTLNSKKLAIESIKIWETQAKEKPDDYKAYWEIACIYKYTLNEYTKSLEFFKKASECNPNDYDIFSSYAGAYWDLKDYKNSAINWAKAIELREKQNAEIPFWLACDVIWSYTNPSPSQDFKKSAEWCNKFLNYQKYTSDDKATLKELLAWSYYNLKEHDKWIPLAIEQYEKSKKPNVVKDWAERLSGYYLENHDATKARIYCKDLDAEFWVCKVLRAHRLTLKYSLHVKTYIMKNYSGFPQTKVMAALPLDLDYQKLISFETDFPKYRLIKDPPYNDVEFDFTDGFPELLKMTMVVDVKVIHHQHDPNKDLVKATDPKDPYYEDATLCDSYYDWKNPEFIQKCAEISAPGKTLYEKARLFQIYNGKHFLHDMFNKEFLKEVSPGVFEHDDLAGYKYEHISEILKSMKGMCRQCSEMYTGMMRTLGVPCRVIEGCTAGKELTGKGADHVTVEIYDAAVNRWFYVEPQGGAHFGINNNEHIIFGEAATRKKYKTNISIFGMRWYDGYVLKNKESLIYESKMISKI